MSIFQNNPREGAKDKVLTVGIAKCYEDKIWKFWTKSASRLLRSKKRKFEFNLCSSLGELMQNLKVSSKLDIIRSMILNLSLIRSAEEKAGKVYEESE